jgi:maleylpyruvate isomerase
VRALALTLVADTHPLGNLRVLKYIKGELGQGEEAKLAWQQHWLRQGLVTFDAMLTRAGNTGPYCHGDTPTLADCCLVPHLFSARRFEVDLAPFPALARIDAACAQLPAFQLAHPSRQPDAE